MDTTGEEREFRGGGGTSGPNGMERAQRWPGGASMSGAERAIRRRPPYVCGQRQI